MGPSLHTEEDGGARHHRPNHVQSGLTRKMVLAVAKSGKKDMEINILCNKRKSETTSRLKPISANGSNNYTYVQNTYLVEAG